MDEGCGIYFNRHPYRVRADADAMTLREQVEQVLIPLWPPSNLEPKSSKIRDDFVVALTTFAVAQRREQARRDAEIARHQIVNDDDPNSMNSYADGVARGIATAIEREAEGSVGLR